MIISENNRKHTSQSNLLAGYYPVKILIIREKNTFVWIAYEDLKKRPPETSI